MEYSALLHVIPGLLNLKFQLDGCVKLRVDSGELKADYVEFKMNSEEKSA